MLHAERHEVELRHLQLPRRVEAVGHERLSAHGPRDYRWSGRPDGHRSKHSGAGVPEAPRDAGGDADHLSGADDPRLHRAQKQRGLSFVDDPDLGRRGGRAPAFVVLGRFDEQHVEAGSVVGAGEQPGVSVVGELVAASNAQVGAGLLELVLDRGRVEPRLASGRDPVVTQPLKDLGIACMAPREVEHELRGDSQAGHAGVIHRAAELVAAGDSRQRGPRLVQHPRQVRVALELEPERPRLLDRQVPRRAKARRRRRGLRGLGVHRPHAAIRATPAAADRGSRPVHG